MNIFTLVGSIALKGAAEAEAQLKGLEGFAKKNEKALKAMGIAMTAAGVAIVGALSLATKAAQDEAINIQRLDQSLKNVGISYDSVKDSLESVITATQRKTGIADSKQRDVLGRLILVTKDYNKALKLLPLTLDLAAASEMDANTAAAYLGKAFLDLENGAESVSLRLGTATVQFKNLAEVEKLVGGQAAATANPFTILKLEIEDLAEAVGEKLLPIVTRLIGKITTVVGGIIDWIKANPEAAKQTILLAGAFGLVMSAVGPLALILPKLPAMLVAVKAALHLLLGPIGWVTLAITALAGIAIIVADNWESIVDPVGKSLRETTATIQAELEKQKQAELNKLSAIRDYAQKEYEAKIEAINKVYGTQARAAQTGADLYTAAITREKAALDTLLEKERTAHEKRMSDMQTEYDRRIAYADAQVSAQNNLLRADIAALNKKTEQEGRALKTQRDQERLADLTKAYQQAKTGEESVRALKELNDFKAEMARDTVQQERQDQIDALQGQIDLNNQAAIDFEKNQREEQAAAETAENEKFKAFDKTITEQKTALDTAQTEGLARIEEMRLAAIKSEDDKLEAIKTRLIDEEKALNESYKRQEDDAAEHARRMAVALGGGTSTGAGGTTIEQPIPAVPPSDWFSSLTGWQHGGMITEPSLITRLRDMKPYAIAGEAGPEPVGFGGIKISGNNFYVRREDDINKIAEAIVGKIRLKAGIRGI